MTLQDTIVIDGDLSLLIEDFPACDLIIPGDGEAGIFTAIREILPIYEGATEITPSTVAQTLNTRNKTVLTEIIINPIPSNYGLIAWNGSALTVS